MIQFYSPGINEDPILGPEEAAHCVRVLRKRPGDLIFVTDGRGKRYECQIIKADNRRVELGILAEKRISKGWNHKITLAVAPTKNADRMAWLVEKATEIGIDRIVFIECRNSERKTVNIERLRRNAVSAMNQSLKTFLPELEGVVPLTEILETPGARYFGYCDSETERISFVKDYSGDSDVIILIGPEGDFSHAEVELLKENGFKAVTFGEERLRTETAALYGITAVHVLDSMNIK